MFTVILNVLFIDLKLKTKADTNLKLSFFVTVHYLAMCQKEAAKSLA